VTVHWSLGYLREHGHTITAYCEQHGPEPMCRHSAPVDIDKAIERFGADFVVPDAYARFVGSLKCTKCGSKRISIQIGSPSSPPIGHTVPVWLMPGRG
jgi:hypothetical protein